MIDFLSGNLYFFMALLFSTGLCWGIAACFLPRKMLTIFFGAWYVVLLLFMACKNLADYISPLGFPPLHLAVIFLLGRLGKTSFTWKQYAAFAVASLIFSLFAFVCILEASLEFRGCK
ncbi:MAG: hypothetical protein IJB29_07570 [Mailhella sp.]|nr:hypothetical protein [Mailhella sp.]